MLMAPARDITRALDPVVLMRDGGLEPDDWQANLLRSASRRVLMLCSRQSGKTTVATIKAEHTALYSPGSLTLIVSPSQRQSGEVFRRLMSLHNKLEGVFSLTAESALRAEFSNGSRIIALPGSEKTTRVYSAVNLIVVDEASRVDDSLLAAIRPMLATVNGSLLMLSTPAGRRGEFHRAWTSGDDTWHRVKVPADQCPRLSKAFLEEELRELGPQMFKQEYMLEFVDDAECMFSVEQIERAFTSEVSAIWQ